MYKIQYDNFIFFIAEAVYTHSKVISDHESNLKEEVSVLSRVFQLEILTVLQEGLFSLDSQQRIKENMMFACQ